MDFHYYERDRMDEIPAPVGKMIVSMVAIVALFLVLLNVAGEILGGW